MAYISDERLALIRDLYGYKWQHLQTKTELELMLAHVTNGDYNVLRISKLYQLVDTMLEADEQITICSNKITTLASYEDRANTFIKPNIKVGGGYEEKMLNTIAIQEIEPVDGKAKIYMTDGSTTHETEESFAEVDLMVRGQNGS